MLIGECWWRFMTSIEMSHLDDLCWWFICSDGWWLVFDDGRWMIFDGRWWSSDKRLMIDQGLVIRDYWWWCSCSPFIINWLLLVVDGWFRWLSTDGGMIDNWWLSQWSIIDDRLLITLMIDDWASYYRVSSIEHVDDLKIDAWLLMIDFFKLPTLRVIDGYRWRSIINARWLDVALGGGLNWVDWLVVQYFLTSLEVCCLRCIQWLAWVISSYLHDKNSTSSPKKRFRYAINSI